MTNRIIQTSTNRFIRVGVVGYNIRAEKGASCIKRLAAGASWAPGGDRYRIGAAAIGLNDAGRWSHECGSTVQ